MKTEKPDVQETIEEIKLLFTSLDSASRGSLLKDLKSTKKSSDKSPYLLKPWVMHADEDLKIANMEDVAPFIRCYHAQQAMEKILKAAFVIAAGTFYPESPLLSSNRKAAKVTSQADFEMPLCAWELNDNEEFPWTQGNGDRHFL